jgi:23S rRNA pseudouridine2605 synthase
VYDYIEEHGFPRLGHVGRLDMDTSGVMVFTNDVRLSIALTSPKYKGLADPCSVEAVEKVYVATVAARGATAEAVAKLRESLHYRNLGGPEGTWTKPADVQVLEECETHTNLQFRLREGRNRQIRRLCTRSRLMLDQLHRVEFAGIRVDNMAAGECVQLTRAQVLELYAAAMPEDPKPQLYDQVVEAVQHALLQKGHRAECSKLICSFLQLHVMDLVP